LDVNNATCLEAKININQETNVHDTFCYPETYGVGCSTHDSNIEPFCDDNGDNPSFCNRSFCYVDPEKCHFSTKSTYAKSAIFPHLVYSYTACGEKDSFREFNIESELIGRTIKVGIPAIYYPDHYRLDEEGNPIVWSNDFNAGVGDLKGIFIDFLRGLAVNGNFDVEFFPVSVASYSGQNEDQWGGCIYDVGRGILDLCVGRFWETSDRRRLAQFSTAVFDDNIVMMVRRPQINDDMWTQIELIFEPFTPLLWSVIVCVTFLVGIIYTILGPDRNTANSKHYIKFTFSDIIENIYFAWSELVQGADHSEKKNTAQRSVALSWSLFVLVIIASYTANLAAFLGQEKVILEIKDLNDCLRKDCLVCYNRMKVLEDTLSSFYPALRKQPVESVWALIDKLEEEECDAILMSEYQWDLTAQLWRECETIFTGQSVMTFNVAWPMSHFLSQSFSYWISKSLEEEGFERVLDEYRPTQKCNSRLDLEIEDDNPQLDVASMTGPLIFLAIGLVFGIFLKFGESGEKLIYNEEEISVESFDLERSKMLKNIKGDSDSFTKDLYEETNRPFQDEKICHLRKRIDNEEELSVESSCFGMNEVLKNTKDNSNYFNTDLYEETNKVLQEVMMSHKNN